jgi:hypothetical protein
MSGIDSVIKLNCSSNRHEAASTEGSALKGKKFTTQTFPC